MSRHALIIGVPGGGVNVSLARRRLQPALERLGFDTISHCSEREATRAGILAAFEQLAEQCGPGDAAFVHYFGHGGRARFTDLLSDQVFGYVTTTKATRGAGFEAILDVELSAYFSDLEQRCGNVTVMLDCCYSGELVRSRGRQRDVALSSLREQEAPGWARAALTRDDRTLALDSHPGILRLCGASPKREAYAAVRSGRHIGRLTEAFLAALEDIGEDWRSLYWEALGHRLREHVVETLEMEGQWVAMAGPVERRLFSTETVDAPGCVSFVPGEEAGRGWLRAGWHQGVSVGDRWSLFDPRVPVANEGADRPQSLLELRVTKVGRNRADVEFDPLAAEEPQLHAGMPAAPLALASPIGVAMEGAPQNLAEGLESSAWLRAASPDEVHALAVDASAQLDSALAQLEDRARLQVLERSWAERSASDCPLRFAWSLADNRDQDLPEQGACLPAGARVCISLELPADAPPLSWFVSVVLVEPGGGLRLLNTRMPEGIELSPGDRESIGWRVGRAGAQGMPLAWPAALESSRLGRAPAKLLFLASRRPIELAHIVRPQLCDRDAALALQGLDPETMRGRKPEHSRGCAWARFEFELERAPRLQP